MNNVVLSGRLARYPEMRYANSGTTIAYLTLAVDRRIKQENGPTADFIRCVAYGKTADFIEKYFIKGMKMTTRGRIQTGSYQDKDGKTVYTTDVVLEDVEFAESKNAGGGADQPTSKPTTPTGPDGFAAIPDGVDDPGLPFN